ncbi:MAG: hypothetical protein M3042_13595 [Actinomycetota bacterium]|nr:hypothetical protein [Actinomycetota bacterium]
MVTTLAAAAAVTLVIAGISTLVARVPDHSAPPAGAKRAAAFSAVPTTLPFGDKSGTYDAARKSLWVLTRDPPTNAVTLSQVAVGSGRTRNWPVATDPSGYRTSAVAIDGKGAVWLGLGRSVVRFKPSTSKFTRWDIPTSLAPAAGVLADGGLVALLPRDDGVHVLVSGLSRLITLAPGRPSPWALGPRLSVRPTYGSRLIALGSGEELVSGGVSVPGGEWQPAVARVSGTSSQTQPGLAACVAQGPTAAVCTASDGSISKLQDTATPIPGATVKEVRLRLATAGSGHLWTWSAGLNRAVVIDTDTGTGRQASISFPLDTVTGDRARFDISGVGPVAHQPAPSGPVTISINPGPQALVVAGSELWLLTYSGISPRDPTAKAAYAAAYRVHL